MLDSQMKDVSVQIRNDILITALDDQEGIVLDVEAKSYYLVNETGLYLLNVIQQNGGEALFSTLRTRMLQDYDVTVEEAEQDISGFLRGLTDRSLASLG